MPYHFDFIKKQLLRENPQQNISCERQCSTFEAAMLDKAANLKYHNSVGRDETMNIRPSLEARLSVQERRQLDLDARIEELSEDMTASFKQISDHLGKIEDRFDKTEEDVAIIKEDIVGIKTDITGVKTDITGIKEAMTGVKTDITGIKADITGVKEDITGIKEAMTGVKTDITGVKTNLTGVKADLTGVKVDIIEIKSTMTTFNQNTVSLLTQILERLPSS